MTTRQRTALVTFLLASLGGSTYAFYSLRGGDDSPVVTTARVTAGAIVDTVGASGTVQAVTTVQVGSQVSGRILSLHADYNSIVKAGQLLATLDPSLFLAQIDQARANLVRAEADVERLRAAAEDAQRKLDRAAELWARELIPQTEREAADVAVRSAQAQVRSAEAGVTQARAALGQQEVNLSHTRITSPIDGIVLDRAVDVGQTVAASMQAPTIFVLAADLTAMQVVASLDESDIGRIRPGQAVTFTVDAYPDDAFEGTVRQVRLQPQVVQNVVTYDTVIDVPNPRLQLKPGMTANVTIEVARRDQAIRVPNSALRFRPSVETFAAMGQTMPENAPATRTAPTRAPENEPPTVAGATLDSLFAPVTVAESSGRLWVLDEGRLTAVPVRLGLSDGQTTELLAGGLTAGDEVVTSVALAGAEVRTSVAGGQNAFSLIQGQGGMTSFRR
jgi:HlyD family secretion protein